MAPIKPVLLATCGLVSAFGSLVSTCAGDSCETGDQTALLQSHLSRKSDLSLSQHSAQAAAIFPKLANLNDPHTRKTALLEMEKTAVQLATMDKSEATDVVITVCTETAELLNTTVMAGILQDDFTDRGALADLYAAFDHFEQQRQDAEDALLAAEAVVTQRASALANCRLTETETCVNETICNDVIDQDCLERDRLEEELREIDEEIHREWCLDGALRTSTDFRTSTIVDMRRYIEVYTALEIAQGLCDEVTQHCETTLSTYLTQAAECNTKQAELQMASCEYHHVASQALALYQQGFQDALESYNDMVALVMVREADRKVEWDVITRVICLLLTLTNEEDGEAASAQNQARIEGCWSMYVDTSHLDIEYLDPPDMLSLPNLPPLPCTAEHEDHYNLGPPEACTALVELHNTQATSECSCLADSLSDQGLMLGHFLLVDPDIDVTMTGGEWNCQVNDQVYSGQVSPLNTQDFADLSTSMLSDDQMTVFEPDGETVNPDYTGPIASIGWAYPSQLAQSFEGALSIAQRFALAGGLVFLNAGGEVIAVRALAAASNRMAENDWLNRPISATLSFSSAVEISEAQASAACSTMQSVPESSPHYAQGARSYCWAMGAVGIPQCNNGCFIYHTTYGEVAFPLIGGLHIVPTQ